MYWVGFGGVGFGRTWLAKDGWNTVGLGDLLEGGRRVRQGC